MAQPSQISSGIQITPPDASVGAVRVRQNVIGISQAKRQQRHLEDVPQFLGLIEHQLGFKNQSAQMPSRLVMLMTRMSAIYSLNATRSRCMNSG